MGLLEVEFTPIVQQVMEKPPKEIETFIRSLILLIDRQSSAIKTVQWSDEIREKAAKTEDELIQFMRSLKPAEG